MRSWASFSALFNVHHGHAALRLSLNRRSEEQKNRRFFFVIRKAFWTAVNFGLLFRTSAAAASVL
jgi:hypothetical protein